MSRFGNLGARLYRGETSYDFIGKRNGWYIVSGILIVVSIAAFFFRGLDYGIEFEGGAVFTADAPGGDCPRGSRRGGGGRISAIEV